MGRRGWGHNGEGIRRQLQEWQGGTVSSLCLSGMSVRLFGAMRVLEEGPEWQSKAGQGWPKYSEAFNAQVYRTLRLERTRKDGGTSAVVVANWPRAGYGAYVSRLTDMAQSKETR